MSTKFKPTKQIGVGGLELGPIEKKYLHEVIESNRLSYGPFSQKFEAEFALEHDCKYSVFCNSGTSALHIALAALKELGGWADDDEVIVPAVTFIATSNIVLHNNMKVVFADVEPHTYNLDPKKLEKKITSKTRAIIPVHLFGMPADMDPIMAIAKKHNLRVIEDSCETMFATYKGKKVGSFGDIGCFSTYIAHFIVTGIGGLATTNDPELAVMLKSLMNHGRDSVYLKIDDDRNVSKEQLFDIAARRFKFVHVGHSFRATEMEAAIGVAQLEQKDKIVAARKKNAHRLIELLKDVPEIQLPTIPPDRDHMFMMFPIVVKNEPKTNLVNYLEERLIETRDMLPLLNQPVYLKLFGETEKDYPVAKWINESGFYVGSHQYLTGEEVVYIADTIKEYFKK